MPAINKDTLATNDLLNRERFASDIAKGLVQSFENGADSFVFGLNGSWGSGKTTLLSFIKGSLQNELSEGSKYKIIDFNPWRFSGKEELLSLFLNNLINEIGPKSKKIKKALTQLGKGLAIFEGVKYFEPTGGLIQQALTKIISLFTRQRSVTELKSRVDKFLVNDNVKLFIFIDDLDRLTSSEIIEIFQIIKLNAGFKNTIFIVAFDKSVVTEILTNEFKIDGEKYLEKIVQVDYRIPDLLDSTLTRIFLTELEKLLGGYQVEYEEDKIRAIWIVDRLRYYFMTLRDVYRYFNAVQLRLPSIKSEVNVYEFLVIEAIRIFDYKAYELIQRNYKKGKQFGPHTHASKLASGIENENTKHLFDYLFETKYRGYENGINNPVYFDRYFALSISEDEIDEDTFRLFKSEPSSRSYLLEQSIKNTSVKSLLSKIQEARMGQDMFEVLIMWGTAYEKSFVENRGDFLRTITSILKSSDDFARTFASLINGLRYNDSNFYPAKYFLLSFFASDISSSSGFTKPQLDVIYSNAEKVRTLLKEFIKANRNRYLTFGTVPYGSDYLHKLFLRDFLRFFPEDYESLIIEYLNSEQNTLNLLRLVIYPDHPTEDQIDINMANTIIPTRVSVKFILAVKKIELPRLSKEEKMYVEIFHQNLYKIESLYKIQAT